MRSVFGNQGCENPQDMDRLKLSWQGYNYGNGYISWALEKFEATVRLMPCSFPRSRQPPMDGLVMVIQSMCLM